MGSGLIPSTDNKANQAKRCFLFKKKKRGGGDPTIVHLQVSVWDTLVGLCSSHTSMTNPYSSSLESCVNVVVSIGFLTGKKNPTQTYVLEEGFQLLSLWDQK